MQIKAIVLSEKTRTYLAKTGQKTITEVSLRDYGATPRCENGFTYSLTPEECDKYKGKLSDTLITIGIERITAYGSGDLSLKGRIEKVEGMASAK